MKTPWALAVRLVVVAVPLGSAAKEPAVAYDGKPGFYAVETARYDWQDKARQREVPVKLYFPKTGKGPFPVIIFSHGLGGSRDGYEYLGGTGPATATSRCTSSTREATRPSGKDQAKPLEAMRQSLKDLRNSINRPLDVRFAIDQMEKINRDQGPLQGRLDLKHLGMAGHSFGAWTTLAADRRSLRRSRRPGNSLNDPRIKAAIAMSPSAPRDKTKLDQEFGHIKVPCLHMTGTLDDSPIGTTKAKDRRLPFDHITAADQCLVVFAGGDHMIFSGRGRLSGGGKDHDFQDLIRPATTAFWDACLKDSKAAKTFLTEGGLSEVAGPGRDAGREGQSAVESPRTPAASSCRVTRLSSSPAAERHRLPAAQGRRRAWRSRPRNSRMLWWLDVDPVGRGGVGQTLRGSIAVKWYGLRAIAAISRLAPPPL